MKELSIEEKAKRYDEAKLRMSRAFNSNRCSIDFMNEIFPELKESEDERIRKALRERIIRYDPNNEILIKECGISQKQFLAWLEKQGEQKPGIIPKFRVGDWIVNNEYGHVIKVLDINKEQYTYRLDYGDTCGTIIISLIDNDYHLWTIQDAKDGDVLATKSGRPFIFKGLLDKCYPENPVAYCGIDSTDEFFLSTGDWMWTNEEVYPASKEQRDTLFAKMKEAGYEWDAEKKELKKISAQSTWSEEDDVMINKLLAVVSLYYGYSGNDLDKQSCISFLKSLKDRYTWKPSDEQIKGIECAIITLRSQLNVGDNRLNSLYNDLKKLREE